jgi:hypothetical protein
MTGKLYLAPATRGGGVYGYFQRAVLDGIERGFYSDYSDANHGDITRVWGLTSSIEAAWETINKGDWFLFYTRKNEYEYAARVIKKEHNPDLGDAIRDEVLDADESENRDWDLLVFFDGFVSVSVSGDKIADLFDYGNRFPVRFIRVTNERLEALEAEYEDIDGFIDSIKE